MIMHRNCIMLLTTAALQRYYIPAPTRALIHRLAEVGHLYQRVDSFVREREGKVGVGMIEQSLCHHLQSQLTEYYRLIAVLESQMSAVHQTDDAGRLNGTAAEERTREEETGLTLKRLDVWIEDWRLRMRMMSVCVEGAKGRSFFYIYDGNAVAECSSQTRMAELWSTSSMDMLRMVIHSFANSPTNSSKRYYPLYITNLTRCSRISGLETVLCDPSQMALLWRAA